MAALAAALPEEALPACKKLNLHRIRGIGLPDIGFGDAGVKAIGDAHGLSNQQVVMRWITQLGIPLVCRRTL